MLKLIGWTWNFTAIAALVHEVVWDKGAHLRSAHLPETPTEAALLASTVVTTIIASNDARERIAHVARDVGKSIRSIEIRQKTEAEWAESIQADEAWLRRLSPRQRMLLSY